MKYNRLLTTFVLGFVLTVASVIIPQYLNFFGTNDHATRSIASIVELSPIFYIKIIGMFVLSFVITLFSFGLKGHLNLFIYTGFYSVGCMIISFIIDSGANYNYYIMAFGIALLFATIINESYQRSRARNSAETTLKGQRLNDFVLTPWKFNENTHKGIYSILYFDIPELKTLVENIDTETLRTVIDFIYEKSEKIIAKHNGIIIKQKDDSIMLAFEPGSYYKEVMGAEADCAYHTVSCALELKQMIEDMKQMINHVIIKQLRARILISTSESTLMKHYRNSKLEYSIFSYGLTTIESLLEFSKGNDIVVDSKTFELSSHYFRGCEITKQAYSIIGLSSW